MNVPSKTTSQGSSQLTESPLRDLEVLIRSRAPLVAVESNEEPQVVSMVRQIAKKLQLKAFRWTATEGLQAFDPMDQPSQSVVKSRSILYTDVSRRCATSIPRVGLH